MISDDHKDYVRIFNVKFSFINTQNIPENFFQDIDTKKYVIIFMDPLAWDFQ